MEVSNHLLFFVLTPFLKNLIAVSLFGTVIDFPQEVLQPCRKIPPTY